MRDDLQVYLIFGALLLLAVIALTLSPKKKEEPLPKLDPPHIQQVNDNIPMQPIYPDNDGKE